MPLSLEFKNVLNDLLSEQGLPKSDFPKEIGITYNSFSNAVNYGIIPKPKVLMRIADYFNVSIEYLLAKTNDEYFAKAKSVSGFNERIESLRASKNLTYYQMSQILHLDESYFSKWKSNQYLPSLDFLFLIADFFNVSIDYLLGRTDDK